MDSISPGIFAFILSGLLAGVLGGAGMNLLMRALARGRTVPVDMVALVGSLLGPRGEKARLMGTAIHLFSGAAFGILYIWGIWAITGAALPSSLFVGLGFGFFHGVIVSFSLMFAVRDGLPAKRRPNDSATLATGIVYIGGHMAYGLIVGVVGSALLQIA